MSFFMFIFDAIFCGTLFFIFQDIMWLVKQLDVFIVVPFLNYTGLAIGTEADLRCGDFFPKKKLSLQIGCFH